MPITPVFEQPPVPRPRNAIDWTEVIDALVEKPGEWARVDGPFGVSSGSCTGREKSLARFAVAAEVNVEIVHRTIDGAQWIYARTRPGKPAKVDQPAPKPVAAVPDHAPRTEFGGDHDCSTCGATFRTNTRLRQHQANAHKAS